MGAQLSRIGVGRAVLVVLACGVLSMVGLVRSGLGGDGAQAQKSARPEVLAPPKVADPDLGGSDPARHAKPSAKVKTVRTKTCVMPVTGAKFKVTVGFKCPKAVKLRSPAAQDLRSGKITLPAQAPKSNGTGGVNPGPAAPGAQTPKTGEINGSPPKPKPKPTTPQQIVPPKPDDKAPTGGVSPD